MAVYEFVNLGRQYFVEADSESAIRNAIKSPIHKSVSIQKINDRVTAYVKTIALADLEKQVGDDRVLHMSGAVLTEHENLDQLIQETLILIDRGLKTISAHRDSIEFQLIRYNSEVATEKSVEAFHKYHKILRQLKEIEGSKLSKPIQDWLSSILVRFMEYDSIEQQIEAALQNWTMHSQNRKLAFDGNRDMIERYADHNLGECYLKTDDVDSVQGTLYILSDHESHKHFLFLSIAGEMTTCRFDEITKYIEKSKFLGGSIMHFFSDRLGVLEFTFKRKTAKSESYWKGSCEFSMIELFREAK